MTSFAPLKVDRFGSVASVTLLTSKGRSAIDLSNLHLFPSAMEEIATDPQIKLIVIRGQGPDFCLGGDLEFLVEISNRGKEYCRQILAQGHQWTRAVLTSRCFVVGLVNGLATGAGVDFAAAMDLTAVTPKAKFRAFYNRLGLVPDLGGGFLVKERVGYSAALRFFLGKQNVRAGESVAIGLADLLLGANDDVDALDEIVAYISRLEMPLSQLSCTKRLLNIERLRLLEAEQEASLALQADLICSSEFRARARDSLRFG